MDALVLLAVFVWGVNYAIVKAALQEIPEFAFNALRLSLASVLFLGVLAFRREPCADGTAAPARLPFPSARSVSRRDWLVIVALAIVGHFIYQLCFMGGIARTSVANSAFIQGCSPVVITAMAAWAGHERASRRQWAGVALSLAGLYLLVGWGAAVSRTSLVGDLLMLAGVFCWSGYVVASRPLLDRLSPLALSGYSMAIGAALYVPLGLPSLARLDWSRISLAAWAGLVYSAVFSLFVAYLVWYSSIRRVGNVRTAMYSNLIPVIALATAILFLGDTLEARELAGAAVILVGVTLAHGGAPWRSVRPAEE